jgi:hypothetical protein
MTNKMNEIKTMVDQVINMVNTGAYLVVAVNTVKKEWALDDQEFDQLYKIVNAIVYC